MVLATGHCNTDTKLCPSRPDLARWVRCRPTQPQRPSKDVGSGSELPAKSLHVPGFLVPRRDGELIPCHLELQNVTLPTSPVWCTARIPILTGDGHVVKSLRGIVCGGDRRD
jgi:hypothetical protein